jgi:citrate lyase subunit beta/citryl-CoA lyase
MKTGLLRSWMFVPGQKQKMIDKALNLPEVAAIMLDIEDGVPPQEKENARQLIGASLAKISPDTEGPARFVRINSIGHEYMYRDIAAVVQSGTEGLAIPKIESPDQVRLVSSLLDQRERDMKLPVGKIRLLVALESPRGLLDAYAIASSSPRVIGMMFGAEDYGKELGLPLNREGEASEMLHARNMLVIATAAARIQSVDGVWPNLKDIDGLKRHTLQSRRLGFTGMSSINPVQIAVINEIFAPSAEELEFCNHVIQLFDEGIARGDGSIALGGQLLDLPIVERARMMVASAKK